MANMLISRKFFTLKYYQRKCGELLTKINPEREIWEKQKEFYYNATGRKLDLSHPKDLNEKLMWLTRYWNHPLKVQCADKFLVREYVKSCGLEHILTPLIDDYKDAEEIDFGKLPMQFVLKCNHGSGYNIVVLDKSKIDFIAIKRKLSEWMRIDFSLVAGERHYHNIIPRIICEKLLQDSAPMEYQFWCVNGEPDSILVCRKNFDGSYDAWSYSLDWNHLCDRKNESPNSIIPKPSNLEEMIQYAKILAKPFPFVRLDLYDVSGKIYFAETTFSPCANVLVNYKEDFINRLGAKLVLPHKYKE